MKKLWILVLAICCMAPMAHADEASKRAKCEKLVELMHMDQTMSKIADMFRTQMRTSIGAAVDTTSLTKKQQLVIDEFEKKSLDLITGYLSWDAMKPDMVKVYAENLTDEEMDGMIAFYGSPTGQSVLAKMPQLMQASMTLTQARMADLQPKMKALTQEYMEKMKAASSSK